MNSTQLMKSLSGLALLVGLITGTALAVVPSSIPESPSMAAAGRASGATTVTEGGDPAAPRPRICSISCRDCLLSECPPGEGTCQNMLCTIAD
ncbi:hypothetical protein D7V80_13315 [Corallococcus sp. CA054B]|uniref:hypothetical protein n=1 Tax=Corallococcus sp. CA054B TaxID=2316734 RepID=UPI000EA3CB55|nr:hypothetical protein [Corallococcus sp. CA054B]RKG68265.1 hypothetical protein D7V80_13315 [Corallococcus sp. CA054B]